MGGEGGGVTIPLASSQALAAERGASSLTPAVIIYQGQVLGVLV